MSYDAYMKVDGVKGEATADSMKDFFEIYSFSWGASNPTNVGAGGAGLTAGKVHVSSFSIMKRTDTASPELFQGCCIGKTFKDAEVQLRKATGAGGQKAFLTYKFTEVMVESIQWSGSSGGDHTPTESVTFAFAKVEISYKPQDDKGALGGDVKASWDNTKVKK